MSSVKLLAQCQSSSTGTVAVCHNHTSANVTMCIIGAHTEIIVATGEGNVVFAKKLEGAYDNATAVCAFGSDSFLVTRPQGDIHLIRVHPRDEDKDHSDGSRVQLEMDVSITALVNHPRKGSHFTSLASAASNSSSTVDALLMRHHLAESDSSSTAPPPAVVVAYATSRDELFRIEIFSSASNHETKTSSSSSSLALGRNLRGSVVSLGRVAGIASLPISKIAVVAENPYIIVAAVHNRLIQIDTRESVQSSSSALGDGSKPSSGLSTSSGTAVNGGKVLVPQRSWLIPPSATTCAATHVTSLSISGVHLSAGTSDGRVIVWDVRGGSASSSIGTSAAGGGGGGAPSDVLAVAPPPNTLLTPGLGGIASAVPSLGMYSNAYSPYSITAAAAANSRINNTSANLLGGLKSTVLSSSSSPASSPASATAPYAITSCHLVGAGALFTTDMRGFAKVWLRPNASLPYEEVSLVPLNTSTVISTTVSGKGAVNELATDNSVASCDENISATNGIVHSSASYFGSAVAAPSVRSGAVGSRLGGNLVFVTIDSLGIVSIFGEKL